MNFEALENDLQIKLQADLGASVSVEVEPQLEAENTQPFVKPRVTIYLDQSEFEKTSSTVYIVQDENTKVILLVRARLLRGDNGVYDLIEKIRKSIVGFQPAGWSKLWLAKISLEERFKGMWCYAVAIAGKSMIVEEAEAPEGPLLTSPKAEFTDNQYN